DAEPDGDDVGSRRVDVGQRRVGEPGGQFQAVAGPVVGVEVGTLGPLGQYGVAQVGDDHAYVPPADVDPDRDAGPAGQPQHRGGPAADRLGGGAVLLRHEAEVIEVGQ